MPPIMKLIQSKNKVTIKEYGSFEFSVNIDINKLTCPCNGSSLKICDHIVFYLQTIGVHVHFRCYLRVPYIRTAIRELNKVTGDAINQICIRFLRRDECVICWHELLKPELQIIPKDYFHQCSQCSHLFHTSCYRRWGKGCPCCMKGHPEPRNNNVQYEEFPTL